MARPKTQKAITQSRASSSTACLPLAISNKPLPELDSPYHVLVRVLAVGLNPTDHKMVTNFYMENNTVGCDFCGIVEDAGRESTVAVGTRVIGADFPYRPNNPLNGAFAEYAVCDSRQTLRVPETWSDTQAAALGAIGFGTACLAISDPDALNLDGLPSKPVAKAIPVLVHGGASATGLVAIQMLKRSGYDPIAVCSMKSASMVKERGAVGTADYNSKTCVQDIKKAANGAPIKHALDCITEPDSVEVCFNAMARVGGRYACLEACPEAWRPKRAVKVKVVMGFESRGVDVDIGHPVYARKANPKLFDMACRWTTEMQILLDKGQITTQAYQEVHGGFEGIIESMEMLHAGKVKGRKLVVRLGGL